MEELKGSRSMATQHDTRSTAAMMTGALLGRSSRTVAITCLRCGTKIADAVPGALARCPTCGTWSGTTERPQLPRRHSPAVVKSGMPE